MGVRVGLRVRVRDRVKSRVALARVTAARVAVDAASVAVAVRLQPGIGADARELAHRLYHSGTAQREDRVAQRGRHACSRAAGELLLERVIVDVPQLSLRGGEVIQQAAREVGRKEVINYHVREGRGPLEARRERRDIAHPRPEHTRERRRIREQVLGRNLDGALVVAAKWAHVYGWRNRPAKTLVRAAVDAGGFLRAGSAPATRPNSAEDLPP